MGGFVKEQTHPPHEDERCACVMEAPEVEVLPDLSVVNVPE